MIKKIKCFFFGHDFGDWTILDKTHNRKGELIIVDYVVDCRRCGSVKFETERTFRFYV